MKPKLLDTNFGKNELNNQSNQNYLQLNYHHHLKFRYLNENVQPTSVDKTMEPIDLSIKRSSSEKILLSNKTFVKSKSNGDKLTDVDQIDGERTDQSTDQLADEQSNTFAEAELLKYNKYNKKKLFLASVRKRKQSSSTDNSSTTSNLSINGATLPFSSSSSSNSPNSTPSSHTSHHSTTSNSDRRNSSSSTSSTNLTLSPNSDNNEDLNHSPQFDREFNSRNCIFDSKIDQLTFSKKFEYYSRYHKSNGSKDRHSEQCELQSNRHANGDSVKSNAKPANESNSYSNHTKQVYDNDSRKNKHQNFNYLRYINDSLKKCNRYKSTYISLKRSRSELSLIDERRESVFNLLDYKRKFLKKWQSESDLIELTKLYRCNREEQLSKQNGRIRNDQNSDESTRDETNKKSNELVNEPVDSDQNLKQQILNDSHHMNQIRSNQQPQSQSICKQEDEPNPHEIKRHTYSLNHSKEEELMNYTKQLMRSNQKSFYELGALDQFNQFGQFGQFNKFDKFDKFNSIKSNSLNLQLNCSKASLTFSNSQFLNKKTLITGQCNKINEKTGKRKFTKLASDEDEEDLEDEDENEENIIVDNLSNTASSSVSPSSIQSNSDSSFRNKQHLVKHHLDRHINLSNLDRHRLDVHNEVAGLDLRLPFLNHPSHLANQFNSLSRRTIPNKQSSFNSLPTDLLQSDSSNLTVSPRADLTSWKFYKDYYYLLLNQPDSPAKLNALQWIMKDLNDKNNHISLNDDWSSEQELIKMHAYKQSYTIDTNGSPLNLTMFNALNRSNSSTLFDQSHHRQLLNTSRNSLNRQKFQTNSPQPMNLSNIQLTTENYLQYVKINENLINSNRHLNNSNQIQMINSQNYLNLENGNGHSCLPPGTPNSFQDRKRISRPLTGRHVRQGTGASPATLANLRSMIKERQKFRELNSSAAMNGKFRKKRK